MIWLQSQPQTPSTMPDVKANFKNSCTYKLLAIEFLAKHRRFNLGVQMDRIVSEKVEKTTRTFKRWYCHPLFLSRPAASTQVGGCHASCKMQSDKVTDKNLGSWQCGDQQEGPSSPTSELWKQANQCPSLLPDLQLKKNDIDYPPET